jgi:hypothetical protein
MDAGLFFSNFPLEEYMDQQEIDKLIRDIQGYLKKNETPIPLVEAATVADAADEITDKITDGSFISPESRRKLPVITGFIRYASYVVEILTIALFTAGIVHPSDSWPKTLMFLLGVLLFGIFAITTLLTFQVRIQLLLKIEDNTRSIAANKARIAEALEKIHIE